MAKPEPVIKLRKPPTPTATAAAEHFVRVDTGSSVPAPAPVAERSEVVVVPQRRTVVTRKDGRRLHRTTIYMPPELSKRLAIHCVEHERNLSDVLADAARRYLDGYR